MRRKTPPEIIESIYIRCLTRKPTEAETKNLLDIVAQAENRSKA